MRSARHTIYINDGPAVAGSFEEHCEVIDVSTNLPRWDPRWEFVDGHGHFHARSADQFPTLDAKTELIECDGSCGDDAPCEGYHRTTYLCSICGEVIEPGSISGPHSERIAGPKSWEATVEVEIPEGERVTLRVDDGTHVIFGVALSTGVSAKRTVGSDLVVSTQLVGVSELGRMQRSERVACAQPG